MLLCHGRRRLCCWALEGAALARCRHQGARRIAVSERACAVRRPRGRRCARGACLLLMRATIPPGCLTLKRAACKRRRAHECPRGHTPRLLLFVVLCACCVRLGVAKADALTTGALTMTAKSAVVLRAFVFRLRAGETSKHSPKASPAIQTQLCVSSLRILHRLEQLLHRSKPCFSLSRREMARRAMIDG